MRVLEFWKKGLVSVFLGLVGVAIIGIGPSFANTILFEDDFETCGYKKYSDVALNQIDRGVSRSGSCSSKIGGGAGNTEN